MPRYGPPPTAEPPPPPPDDTPSLTRWSFRRKILAVVAGLGMITAFVFNFLSPTSSGIKESTTTSSSVTTSSSTTTSSTTTSSTSTTTTVVSRSPTVTTGR